MVQGRPRLLQGWRSSRGASCSRTRMPSRAPPAWSPSSPSSTHRVARGASASRDVLASSLLPPAATLPPFFFESHFLLLLLVLFPRVRTYSHPCSVAMCTLTHRCIHAHVHVHTHVSVCLVCVCPCICSREISFKFYTSFTYCGVKVKPVQCAREIYSSVRYRRARRALKMK